MVRAMANRFWLMKSEPDQFGIADLARVKVEPWTGVRSYFARAHMRAMSVGDAVLFHHSNATPPGVAGLARVVRTGIVDETQFDPDSPYYDPKGTREAPIWDCVEVEYVATLPHFVALDRIRAEPGLADMLLVQRGMRLSVQPVTEAQYETIVALGDIAPPPPPPKPAKATRLANAARPAKAARAARPAKAARAARPTKAARAVRPARAAKPAAKHAKSRAAARSDSSPAAKQAKPLARKASAQEPRR
jgi:predicted RNA-binding protein with PUA-like domain